MRRLVVGVLVAGFAILTVAACAGGAGDGGANRLLVEATGLVKQAEASNGPSARADLYKRALGKLDEIVAGYPANDLAVRLATDQPIGALDRAEVTRRWYLARGEACIDAWDRSCFLSVTLEMTMAYGDSYDHSWARMVISQGLAETKALIDALATARSIEILRLRAWAFGAIAKSMADAGMHRRSKEILAEAVKTAQSIGDLYGRSWAFGSIGAWQADAGDAAGARQSAGLALQAIDKIVDPVEQVRVLIVTAEPLAGSGNLAKSRRALSRIARNFSLIGDPFDRIDLLSDIAWVQADIGDTVAALRTLERASKMTQYIPSGPKRAEAWASIVYAGGNLGEYEFSFEIIKSIDTKYWRATALAMTAGAQAKYGDSTGARRTADLVFEQLKGLKNLTHIADVFVYLADSMSKQSACRDGIEDCEFQFLRRRSNLRRRSIL